MGNPFNYLTNLTSYQLPLSSGCCRLRGIDFLNVDPTAFENVFAQTETQQGSQRCFHHVRRILGTKRLRENVLHTGRFQHRADRFAGDDSRSGRSRAEQHSRATVMIENLVRNGGTLQGHAHHVATSRLAAFANRIRDFAGFAETHAHAALLVTNDNERAEIKPATAFNDLRGTVDEDDLLNQFLTALRVEIDFGFTATTARTATASATVVARLPLALTLRLLLLLLLLGSALRCRLPFGAA